MFSIKITLASQARSIKLDMNLRIKAMKCCTNIYFNRRESSDAQYYSPSYPKVILTFSWYTLLSQTRK